MAVNRLMMKCSTCLRGHTAAQVEQAVRVIRQYPSVQLGLQILPGLPGDTLEKSVRTAEAIVELAPDFTRIYPALVISGTELEWLYATHQYKPLSIEEAVRWTAEIWLPLLKADIPVIRMGLHASDDLREGTVLAGPFHPSFRQLVEEELFRRLLKRMMERVMYGSTASLQVSIHPADETALRGRKGESWKQAISVLVDAGGKASLMLDRSLPRRQLRWQMEEGPVQSLAFTDL